jgi:hypothetical protein
MARALNKSDEDEIDIQSLYPFVEPSVVHYNRYQWHSELEHPSVIHIPYAFILLSFLYYLPQFSLTSKQRSQTCQSEDENGRSSVGTKHWSSL